MSAYEALAGSYDSLTYDIPYEEMLTYMEALLQRHNVRPETVLDLACGTGSMSVLLAKRGYRVIAADLSEDMLAVASEKASELEENFPLFICQRMERLRLPYAVDWVVCCLDSLNYVTEPEKCREALKRVHNSLSPGGALIFVLFCATKYGWGFDKYLEETNTGDGLKMPRALKPYFQFVLPVMILVIIIQGLI